MMVILNWVMAVLMLVLSVVALGMGDNEVGQWLVTMAVFFLLLAKFMADLEDRR